MLPEMSPFEPWAEFYDLMDRDVTPFVAFYRSMVTEDVRALLDLGCGTGTITTALVNAQTQHGPGRSAVGLDESEAMLAVARDRDPGVEWVAGDMRSPPVGGPFDLVVCCFNTLQMLTDDADLVRTFRSVGRLLAPSGRFAFDVYQPNLDFLSRGHVDRLAKSATDPAGRRLETREDAHYDPETSVLTLDWRLLDDTSAEVSRTTFELRQYFPDDLRRLLSDGGLEVVERYGELDRSPFTATSKRQVMVCRAAPVHT